MSLENVDVLLYVDAAHELATLRPVGDEMAQRGAKVRVTNDFTERSRVGLYACHPNRFFDFQVGQWKRPANDLAVLAVHDLGQADCFDPEYFVKEPWHAFDLGLLPGPAWKQMWEEASRKGCRGPVLGMRAVGWMKMDHVFARPNEFNERVSRLRAELDLDHRPIIMLACSWSDRRQLTDTLRSIGPDDFQVVVKYPVGESPLPGSPWFDRLSDAYEELQLARTAAVLNPLVKVAEDDVDVMELLALADVVVSNGSNVLYEGILMGVPGVCVQDWVWPAGRFGEHTVCPRITLPGVLAGGIDTLPSLIKIVRGCVGKNLVAEGRSLLVEDATKGNAAKKSADEIETVLRFGYRFPGEPSVATDEVAALRAELTAAAARELHARETLEAFALQIQQLTANLDAVKGSGEGTAEPPLT